MANRYNVDPQGLARQAHQNFSNPLYMLPTFQRLMGSSQPGLNDYLAMQRAQGGSSAIANEQFQAAQRQGQGAAYDAFNQYRAGADQSALQALGMDFQNRQFATGLQFQDQQARAQRRSSLVNTVLGGALGTAGFLLAGPAGAALGAGIGSRIGGSGPDMNYGLGNPQYVQGQIDSGMRRINNWSPTLNR